MALNQLKKVFIMKSSMSGVIKKTYPFAFVPDSSFDIFHIVHKSRDKFPETQIDMYGEDYRINIDSEMVVWGPNNSRLSVKDICINEHVRLNLSSSVVWANNSDKGTLVLDCEAIEIYNPFQLEREKCQIRFTTKDAMF